MPQHRAFWIRCFYRNRIQYGLKLQVPFIDTDAAIYLKNLTGYNVPTFDTITLLPIQLHAIVFALFASLIAPFGGFFASGLKRAFNVKDFADAIPGHGGITDRMDCQFMMGVFANMYYTSFIGNIATETAIDALFYLKNNFTVDELVQVYGLLGEYLGSVGAFNSTGVI
jgi:hypothetical protein